MEQNEESRQKSTFQKEVLREAILGAAVWCPDQNKSENEETNAYEEEISKGDATSDSLRFLVFTISELLCDFDLEFI